MFKRSRPVWSSLGLAVSLGLLAACSASDAGESKPTDMATQPPVEEITPVGAAQLQQSEAGYC